MKLLPHLAVAVVCGLLYLAGEGAYALWRGNAPGWSLTHQALQRFDIHSSLPGGEPSGSNARVVRGEAQLRMLLEDFRRDGVALGNTPFAELHTEKAAVNAGERGCRHQKPNLDKTFVFLRSFIFHPFNPPLAFYDSNAKLSAESAEFLGKYGMSPVRHQTNEYGERLTLPLLERSDKIIVAGDSVANGISLADEHTLASRLQALDDTHQYVNIGVGGAESEEILCNLDRAAQRYQGKIRGLIYVYCENDFNSDQPYGQPEEVIERLREFAEKNDIRDVTVVYAPYIFNIFPETTRIKGLSGWDHTYYTDEQARLRQVVRDTTFNWIDIGEIALEERATGGSLFTGLGMFMDLVHLSPHGSSIVAGRILKGS